jgi:DNA-binding GntR family transcriptional regulator
MLKPSLRRTDSSHNGRIARDRWLELLLQVRASELSGAAKIAGATIAMHLNPETERCELTREAIADRCGMDSRSCRRMIKHLEDAGWLSVKRSVGFFANSFELTTPNELTAASSMIGGRANV